MLNPGYDVPNPRYHIKLRIFVASKLFALDIKQLTIHHTLLNVPILPIQTCSHFAISCF